MKRVLQKDRYGDTHLEGDCSIPETTSIHMGHGPTSPRNMFKCKLPGPTLDLLGQNLHFTKIFRGFIVPENMRSNAPGIIK